MKIKSLFVLSFALLLFTGCGNSPAVEDSVGQVTSEGVEAVELETTDDATVTEASNTVFERDSEIVKNEEIIDKAYGSDNAKLCEKIENLTQKNSCVLNIAIKLKDPQVCESLGDDIVAVADCQRASAR